jgi:hypothetical protein
LLAHRTPGIPSLHRCPPQPENGNDKQRLRIGASGSEALLANSFHGPDNLHLLLDKKKTRFGQDTAVLHHAPS